MTDSSEFIAPTHARTYSYTDPPPLRPEQIVDALVPVIEAAIARRAEDIYGAIEQLRGEFQATINVMDGNDAAIIAAVQEMRGVLTGDGYQVSEVLSKAGASWERFVRAEAEQLGLKVIVPKGEQS